LHGLRVHLSKIRARLSATALSGHCDDVVAANDKDTGILDGFTIVNEKHTPVNIHDASLALFASVLLDGIVIADFGSVSVGRYGIPVLLKDAGYLRVDESTHVSGLVHCSEYFSVNFDDTSYCRGTRIRLASCCSGKRKYLLNLHKVVEFKVGVTSESC
jgi:hypothetical protein